MIPPPLSQKIFFHLIRSTHFYHQTLDVIITNIQTVCISGASISFPNFSNSLPVNTIFSLIRIYWGVQLLACVIFQTRCWAVSKVSPGWPHLGSPPHTRPDTQLMHDSLERSCGEGLRPPRPAMLLGIFICLAQHHYYEAFSLRTFGLRPSSGMSA